MEKKLASKFRLMELLSTEEGALRIGSSRMILMSSKAYMHLVRSIHQHAPHAVAYLLYEAGYRSGEDFMGTLRHVSKKKEDLMTYALETFKQAGYGDFELVEFDLKRPFVRIAGRNLFEVPLVEEAGIYRTPRSVDHYSRGMFAGLFSQLLGMELACEELECQGREDEACHFIVSPFSI